MSHLTLKEQLAPLALISPISPISPIMPAAEEPILIAVNNNNNNRKNKIHQKSRVSQPNSTNSNTNAPSQSKQKPTWLEHAQYGVELLKAHFPACFKEIQEIQPLKIGIKQDLVKKLGSKEDITLNDKACMVSSLSYYVSSPAYHRSVLENAIRIDLEGHSAGTVTTEEARYSSDSRKMKQQRNANKATATTA